MRKVLMFQAFWTDGQVPCTRTRNLEYSSSKNIKLLQHLRYEGVGIDYRLYDFSPEKVLDRATHIPYPKGVYKRSEKLNRIVQENNHYDVVMSLDCDTFFDEKDFDLVRKKINKVTDNTVSIFDMAKLDDAITERIIEKDDVNPHDHFISFAFNLQKRGGTPLEGAFGGMGGVFLCGTKLFEKVGGFDEKYTTWGDEDVDILSRIREADGKIVRNHDLFPFHLSHFRDMDNEDYIEPCMKQRWEQMNSYHK